MLLLQRLHVDDHFIMAGSFPARGDAVAIENDFQRLAAGETRFGAGKLIPHGSGDEIIPCIGVFISHAGLVFINIVDDLGIHLFARQAAPGGFRFSGIRHAVPAARQNGNPGTRQAHDAAALQRVVSAFLIHRTIVRRDADDPGDLIIQQFAAGNSAVRLLREADGLLINSIAFPDFIQPMHIFSLHRSLLLL